MGRKKSMVTFVAELMEKRETREEILKAVNDKGFTFKNKAITKGRLKFTIKAILDAGIVEFYKPCMVKDKERRAEIKKMLEDGERLVTIADKYGFSKQRAMQIAQALGINPKDVRQKKRVVLAKNINADINKGISYCGIKSKYNMDGGSLYHLGQTVEGFNGTYAKSTSRRNDKIIESFKKGHTASEIAKTGLCNISSVRSIYTVLSRAGVKRYPHINTRNGGGWNDDPKVMSLINQYVNVGFTASEISDLLNNKGFKTQQGVVYKTSNVSAKIRAIKSGKKKAKK